LYHLLNNWFDRFLPKHRYVVEHIESPTAVYVGMMNYNGLPVDKELMEQKGIEADRRISEIKKEIAFIIGDVPIGQNASTTAFRNYLFVKMKLPKVKETAKEQASLDDESLILLREHCAKERPELVRLFELVQELRTLGKLYELRRSDLRRTP